MVLHVAITDRHAVVPEYVVARKEAPRLARLLGTEKFFEPLDFDNAHVRLQCERELKALLIGLRQGLLASAGEEKFIGVLEVEMGEALIRTLRGMLWLKGQRQAKPALEVVAEIEKLTKRDLPGLRTSLNAAAVHGWEQFESLYTDVAALAEAADGW